MAKRKDEQVVKKQSALYIVLLHHLLRKQHMKQAYIAIWRQIWMENLILI